MLKFPDWSNLGVRNALDRLVIGVAVVTVIAYWCRRDWGVWQWRGVDIANGCGWSKLTYDPNHVVVYTRGPVILIRLDGGTLWVWQNLSHDHYCFVVSEKEKQFVWHAELPVRVDASGITPNTFTSTSITTTTATTTTRTTRTAKKNKRWG